MSRYTTTSYSFVLFSVIFVMIILLTVMTIEFMRALEQKESFVNWKKFTKKTGLAKLGKTLEKVSKETGVTKVAKQIEKYGKTSIHELKKAKQVNWKLLATSPTQIIHKNTGCESKGCVQIPKTIHTKYGRIIICEKVDAHFRKYTNKVLHIEIDKIAIQPNMITVHPRGKVIIQFQIPSVIDTHRLTCKPHLEKQSVFQPILTNSQYLKLYWNQKIVFIKRDGTEKIKIISHKLSPYLYNYLVTIQFTCEDMLSFMSMTDTLTKKGEVFLNRPSNVKIANQKPPSPPVLTAATALYNMQHMS